VDLVDRCCSTYFHLLCSHLYFRYCILFEWKLLTQTPGLYLNFAFNLFLLTFTTSYYTDDTNKGRFISTGINRLGTGIRQQLLMCKRVPYSSRYHLNLLQWGL
jgi:hypothetical protein